LAQIIGIDLGTTNSAVAAMHGGEPVIIPTAEGERLCPSVVAFTAAGERLVGEIAKRQCVTNAARTICSAKRRMGTDWSINIDGKPYSAPEVSAAILEKLRADAEAFLGEAVARAVITVPAYFSDAQRQATRDAGRIAGLDVARIINEPTAAALAYGLQAQDLHTVLVWDLGGGTFDVSVLELGDGVFEVKATSGDTHLGGDDWDERIVGWLADEFKAEHGLDLRADATAMQRLREAAERAKIELSTLVATRISLPFISASGPAPRHLERELTRAHFEHLSADLLERVVVPTRTAMADARVTPEDLDRIILVGGLTRMPAVVALVTQLFGQPPHCEINPDEAVAVGAAIQAAVLAGEVRDIVLLDVTPLSMGIETAGGVFQRLIMRNTTMPVRTTETFTTAADNQSAVDLHVLQGEREMAADNISLGRFQLGGLRPAPKGVPRIQVTFDIDVNGILHVSARDVATGGRREVEITPASGLSPAQVERLIADADANRDRDRRKREAAQLRLRVDDLLASADRVLSDAAGKLPQATTQPLADVVSRARETDAGTSLGRLRQVIAELERASYEVTEALYRYNAAEQASQAAGRAGERAPGALEGEVRGE